MSSDVRPVFDDLHLWDDADESPLVKDIPVWIAGGVTGSDTWTLVLSHQCDYRMHRGAIMIITSLISGSMPTDTLHQQ